ncbi:hypothetical protein, partial [Marinobacter nauticus]|uniref:hypothetical protein n=1 Tax=Marinobacter nauticus TaxID=2743 RepID=UPI001C692DF7
SVNRDFFICRSFCDHCKSLYSKPRLFSGGITEGLQDIEVHYSEVIGFRALDEGDLLEFWEHFNLRDGWIFRVHKGGWFDLESTRGGFTSAYSDFLKEFLIIGEDLCISVISKDDPVFKQAQNS